MSTNTLDRIPARGITRKEHDAFVLSTGRNYTEPYRAEHKKHQGPLGTTGGLVRAAKDSINIPDPHAHPPTCH
jgi:hypothetical protein